MKQGLTFDDVALVPVFNNVESRTVPDLKTMLTTMVPINIPIIASNMDSVISPKLAQVMRDAGSVPIFHRFAEYSVRFEWAKSFPDSFISSGIRDADLSESLKLLENTNVLGICLDIAHGHDSRMLKAINKIRQEFPDVEVIAGNVCTVDGYRDLVSAGANCVKIGIGPGCFGAGTRILMANGFYKNIEDIKFGDFLINKDGKSVKVKRAWKTGIRKISKIKTNAGFEIIATPDHNFLVGDLSSSNVKSIGECGYKNLLLKQSKTIPKQNKIKWMEIQNLKQGCLLFPSKINFDLPKTFSIPLMKRTGGNWRTGAKYSEDYCLYPTYELGYLFGTFLGDGNATSQGSASWVFGKNEEEIADKLLNVIYKIFNKKAKKQYKDNTIRICFYYKPLADFLLMFGKRSNKALPEQFFIENEKYLQGLQDGLIDSDGSISPNKRISFSNTSIKLIELFNVLSVILNGHIPNIETRLPSSGGLKNCDIKNCNISYVSRQLLNPHNRKITDFQIIKLLQYEDLDKEQDVYDIEVDCSTHSFIANNIIVHNSACTTRMVTGFGVPQFTAIQEIAAVKKKLFVPIIADGGIRGSADIVKALAAGADSVMIGKLLALTNESAALKRTQTYMPMVDQTGAPYAQVEAKYRGQASADFQEEYFGGTKGGTVPEGEAFWAPVSGTAIDAISNLLAGIRSGMTYGGARTIPELQRKAEFIQVTQNYNAESNPRP